MVFNLPYEMLEKNKEVRLNMKYNPITRTWESLKAFTSTKQSINKKVTFTQKINKGGNSPTNSVSTAFSSNNSPASKRATSINRTAAPKNNNFTRQSIVKPKQRAVSMNKTAAPRA